MIGAGKEYFTKDARHFINELAKQEGSHYREGYIADAMKILKDNRSGIQKAIFRYCDKINKRHRNEEIWIDDDDPVWSYILAGELIDSFLKDNNKRIFKKERLTEIYNGNFALFFGDLMLVLSDQTYPENLRKLYRKQIKNEMIAPGWLAILREFGMFSPTGNRLGMLSESIVDEVEISGFGEIQKMVERYFTGNAFIASGVHCPASTQVRNHFALCVGLNAGLIRSGKYSDESRIGMIKDENGHFKSVEDMKKEFEEKIGAV